MDLYAVIKKHNNLPEFSVNDVIEDIDTSSEYGLDDIDDVGRILEDSWDVSLSPRLAKIIELSEKSTQSRSLPKLFEILKNKRYDSTKNFW